MYRNIHKLNTPREPPPLRRKGPPSAPRKPAPVDFQSVLPPRSLTAKAGLCFYLLGSSRETTHCGSQFPHLSKGRYDLCWWFVVRIHQSRPVWPWCPRRSRRAMEQHKATKAQWIQLYPSHKISV